LAKQPTATLVPRRRHSLRVRLDTRLLATITGARRATAIVRDLALRGAFLETEQQFAVGDALQVKILAGVDSIESAAQVRNVTSAGIGVEFTNVSRKQHTLIRNLITKLME